MTDLKVFRATVVAGRYGDITIEVWSDGEVFISQEEGSMMLDTEQAKNLATTLQSALAEVKP